MLTWLFFEQLAQIPVTPTCTVEGTGCGTRLHLFVCGTGGSQILSTGSGEQVQ